MSLLICIPDSMQPQYLCSALQSLDSGLKIEIGSENVHNQDEVEFAVVWKHQRGILKRYPNYNYNIISN